ncbi:MAG: hypothetical protein KGZ58_03485 [Ignavibacteriales bacterium]|nr:hypothetical protein [Ignavibacteriales bacterium]
MKLNHFIFTFLVSFFITEKCFSQEPITGSFHAQHFFDTQSFTPIRQQSFPEDNRQTSVSKKSPPLAVFLSLVLPGLGELYSGNFSSGKYFMLADAGLWLTYGGFYSYASWVQNDARQFAKKNADVSLSGKDDKFFVNIGNYSSLEAYNNAKLLQRQTDKLYLPESKYYWNWTSEATRREYRQMRIDSDLAFNNLKFVATGLILNRIASAVNAGLAVSSSNKNLQSSLQLHVQPMATATFPTSHGIQLMFSHSLR